MITEKGHIYEVSGEQYDIFIKDMDLFYNQVDFNLLNRQKVDDLKYLVFESSKKYFGLIIGVRDKAVFSPFSAPFSMPVTFRSEISVSHYGEFVRALNKYLDENEYSEFTVTLPSTVYSQSEISKWMNAFLNNGYQIKFCDLNYQLDLSKLEAEQYTSLLSSKARNKLRGALKNELRLYHCQTEADRKKAYDIIAQNRREKGYPLRMSFFQLEETIKLTQYDYFIVYRQDVAIAAAIIYYVTKEIVQIIYWGNIQMYEQCRPVNFMAYELVRYYGEKGMKYIDIGTSTEEGVPNVGLCDFKESIGCDVSAKFTLGLSNVKNTIRGGG